MLFTQLVLSLMLALQPPTNILIIGDSQAGYVSQNLDSLESYGLEDNIKVKYKGGTTIEHWNKYYLKDQIEFDEIIIFLGSNDYWKKSVPDISNILEFASGKKCIWVGPPRIEGKRYIFNKLLKASVESNGACKYIDSEEFDIELFDGTHPSKLGAEYWLKLIWNIKANI